MRAVPDLIAFYENAPPLIVDWKVHAFGVQEARLQLATYALALCRCNAHKDFPESMSRWQPLDVRLLEVQLLLGRTRSYALAEDDAADIDAHIAATATDMLLVLDGRKSTDLRPCDFPVAASPEACQRCSYRVMCWEDDV